MADRERPDGSDVAPLFGAIEEASRHLGVAWEPEGSAPPPPDPGRGWGWVVAAVLGVAGAGILVWWLLAPPPAPPAYRVEEDLRWAVAQVVERVEELRLSRGALPSPEELHTLLGPAVQYEPGDSLYRVVGERAGVVVEYDGTLPLATWRRLTLYGARPPG